MRFLITFTQMIAAVWYVSMATSTVANAEVLTPEMKGLLGAKSALFEKVRADFRAMEAQQQRQSGDLEAKQEALKEAEAAKTRAKDRYDKAVQHARDFPEYELGAALTDRFGALQEATRALTVAKDELAAANSALKSTNREQKRLARELDRARKDYESVTKDGFDSYIYRLQTDVVRDSMQEAVVTSRCGDDQTPIHCRNNAVLEAERKVLEQGSVAKIQSISEMKDFQLTRDEVRSVFDAVITSKEFLRDERGLASHTIHLRATVKPTLTTALRAHIERGAAIDFNQFLRDNHFPRVTDLSVKQRTEKVNAIEVKSELTPQPRDAATKPEAVPAKTAASNPPLPDAPAERETKQRKLHFSTF